jgi:hypothetical protein
MLPSSGIARRDLQTKTSARFLPEICRLIRGNGHTRIMASRNLEILRVQSVRHVPGPYPRRAYTPPLPPFPPTPIKTLTLPQQNPKRPANANNLRLRTQIGRLAPESLERLCIGQQNPQDSVPCSLFPVPCLAAFTRPHPPGKLEVSGLCAIFSARWLCSPALGRYRKQANGFALCPDRFLKFQKMMRRFTHGR